MKKLILHIGHNKTGSSFIQSMLALNAEFFKDEFFYPHHKNFEKASKGGNSNGNGSLLFSNDVNLDQHKTTVFSTEYFFNELIDKNKNDFELICKKYDVYVLLYSRNVLEYLFSAWVQSVKSAGYVNDFETYLSLKIKNKLQPYNKIIKWLDAADCYKFNLIFRNYSNHRTGLFKIFLKDIFFNNLEKLNFKSPPSLIVNRSLSNIELEFQRVFNAFDKKSGSYISHKLVESLPYISPAQPRYSDTIYDIVLEKFTPLLVEINSRVDPMEALLIGDRQKFVMTSNENSQAVGFTTEQIEILAESLTNNFSSSVTLEQSVDDLRDIALKIESKKELGLDDALVLMKLAQSGRPKGPLISQKVLEWEERLQSTAGQSPNSMQE